MIAPTKIKAETINIIWKAGFGFSVFFFVLISICSDDIIFWPPNFSYHGFDNFIKYYSFPIAFAAFTTTLLGIVVAIKKYQQSEEHFNKNHKIITQNIHFNNYLKHMEIYTIFMVDYFKYFNRNIAEKDILLKKNNDTWLPISVSMDNSLIRYRLTRGYFSDIYLKWFFRDFSNHINNHIIKPEIIKIISSFSEYFLENYNEILQQFNLAHLNIDHFSYIHELMQKIFLFDVTFTIDKNDQPINNFRMKVIIALIKKTLDFSEQKIDNIDILYDLLCKSKP